MNTTETLTNTDREALAELLFRDVTEDISTYLNRYKKRSLSEGAIVTRFAPSPTGFVHIGGLFTALVAQRMAEQTHGVFFLRIEDTDKEREVAGGVEEITRVLKNFGLPINEGVISGTEEVGDYGPYTQSKRLMIYRTFVKELVRTGNAYPCFCTSEELEAMREEQMNQKIRPGYYGVWAKHRHLTLDEIKAELAAGKSYVIRLRSNGSYENQTEFNDLIKGAVTVTENDTDVVLLKSDSLPTYHFAHVVDDHLMGTTHVIRGDEWLSSLPIHLQLFTAFGWPAPQYGHLAPMMKLEDGNKRKLSKRKDPESAVAYYDTEGYPREAITEYLLNIANSDFEDWRTANPDLPNTAFTLSLSRFNKSGALFDIEKLDNTSKTLISRMTADTVYDAILTWAGKYDQNTAELLTTNESYVKDILAIERGGVKPRKDISKWSQIHDTLYHFFEPLFLEYTKTNDLVALLPVSVADSLEILRQYLPRHNTNVERDVWFNGVRELATELGFCPDMKAYKANPDAYKGSVADVSMVLRVALTGKTNAPDLYTVMTVMGETRVKDRLAFTISLLEASA